jgi:hypothetical protein
MAGNWQQWKGQVLNPLPGMFNSLKMVVFKQKPNKGSKTVWTGEKILKISKLGIQVLTEVVRNHSNHQ